jgi:hypothetical protein
MTDRLIFCEAEGMAHRVSLVLMGVSQGYSSENRVTALALAA